MPKSKFYKIAAILFIFIAFTFYYCKSKESFDPEDNVKKYKALLKQEPNNCHYLEQLANSYQVINDFDKSINFYKQTLKSCPDDLSSMFQLGVSYFMIMERKTAEKYWDQAIQGAKNRSDRDLEELFIEKRKAWLGHWEAVKSMEWNKDKKGTEKRAGGQGT